MIYIYDFNDSFTYNLFSDLYHYSKVEVIPFKNILKHLESLLLKKKKVVIVLGPGPGSPEEYKEYIPLINQILLKQNIFTFGVCLGHQLIWQSLGQPVRRSTNPQHGQSVEFKIGNFFSDKSINQVTLQRYNSLSVFIKQTDLLRYKQVGWNLVTNGQELLMSRKNNILSYQYHPESIGSLQKDVLYSPVREFLL